MQDLRDGLSEEELAQLSVQPSDQSQVSSWSKASEASLLQALARPLAGETRDRVPEPPVEEPVLGSGGSEKASDAVPSAAVEVPEACFRP